MAKIKSLSDQVYDYIVHKIKFGEISYNEKINENDLIKQLGISRTPIREALIQLASDGILENLPRKGFYVKFISPEVIQEVYDIIACLDAYAVSLAIPNITSTNIANLNCVIEQMDMAINNKEYELYSDYQEQFHSIYLSACKNNTLVELIKSLQRKYIRTTFYSTDTDKLFSILAKVNEEHEKIVKFISEKDIDNLTNAIKKHWSNIIPGML